MSAVLSTPAIFSIPFALTIPGGAPIFSSPPAQDVCLVSAIVLGLLVGSFLNVVIHRLPVMLMRAWRAGMNDGDNGNDAGHADNADDAEHARHADNADNGDNTDNAGNINGLPSSDGLPLRYNLWLPRSACVHCGHVLRLWENIPVASWLILRGRCSQCRTRISLRYPAIELASAACAVAALVTFGPTGKALAAFGLCAVLLAASAIDLDHQLLPDALTLPLLWAGLAVNLGNTFCSLPNAVLGAMAGYVALWCVSWLFRLLRGMDGMGHGDVKLLAALGAWLGWAALPQIVAMAALLGAIVGLTATALKRMHFTQPLPFGPYLAVGAFVTLFWGTPYQALFYGLR
jgi:leader peptidase (prepilin peptidase)/N-methyltransferase